MVTTSQPQLAVLGKMGWLEIFLGGGGEEAYTWTENAGIRILSGDSNDLQRAHDVTADGSIQVGDSSLGAPGVNAVYWDAEGLHALIVTPNGAGGRAQAISPDGTYFGGWLAYVRIVDSLPDAVQQAVVWDADRNVIPLVYADGEPFRGEVWDISNHGYAVGQTLDSSGFIWHESFTEPMIFEDWFFETSGVTLPTPSTSVVAIAEDLLNDELIFAVNGSAYFASADVEFDDESPSVPEPSTGVLFGTGLLLLLGRRMRKSVLAPFRR